MSEYQYYEFTAVDRPLTTREQSELRSLSTRADITASSFVNTYIGGGGLLASIIGVRASLAAGDLRLLYLGWLRRVQSLEVSDDELEPPVPAGLATLDAPLTAVADFLCIDRDLIAAAAGGSPPAQPAEPGAAQLRTWVTRLPTREKDTILSDLITGDDIHLRAQLLRRYRDAHATEAVTTTTSRTAGELLAAAGELRAVHARKPSLLERLDLAGLDV